LLIWTGVNKVGLINLCVNNDSRLKVHNESLFFLNEFFQNKKINYKSEV